MMLIINGKLYQINHISQEIDQAFIDFHAAFLGDHPLNWDAFSEKVVKFFDPNEDNRKSAEAYFQNFTIIASTYTQQGLWDKAEVIWQLALQPILEWEKINQNNRIHKGSPFYFWGMVAIQRGDIDKGYVLMHQALEEDKLTSKKELPDTPALAFATLNYKKAEQAFRDWVLTQASYLEERLMQFQQKHGIALTLDDFTSKYLEKPPSSEVIYLLAYNLARLLRYASISDLILASPFAGILFQNVLFDMVQVIDSTISPKNSGKWKMFDHVVFLSEKLGVPINEANLIEANRNFQSSFEESISLILAGNFKFKDGSVASPIQSDLLIAYALRNRGAHDISSAKILWARYRDLLQAVFNALFLVVSKLY